MGQPIDSVTQLQQVVDTLALNMFNGLRNLPTALEPSQREALSSEVLTSVKLVNEMIDQLPGLDSTESEQMEQMAKLQTECDAQGEKLIQVANEAEVWIEKSRLAMGEVARDKLKSRS